MKEERTIIFIILISKYTKTDIADFWFFSRILRYKIFARSWSIIDFFLFFQVPHHIPFPVPVKHPVAVPVPQIVKVPHHVPVPVEKPVPVELHQQVLIAN